MKRKNSTNIIVIDGDFAFIHLTKGYVAVIDVDDVETARRHKWFAAVRLRPDGSLKTVYVASEIITPEGKRTSLLLHRLLAGMSQDSKVDHNDCDGLNNRRSNLRVCSNAENTRNQRMRLNNTSGYKGVSWRPRARRWTAQIKVDGKYIHLGNFRTPEEATAAYDTASVKYFGEFALPNNVILFPARAAS